MFFPSIANFKCTLSDRQMYPWGCMYPRLGTPALEDDIVSAFVPQLPRCIVYLHYFCCISNRLICCSSCDMKEEAGARVKSEENLQGDTSFNDLQNMLLLVSSLVQVAEEQMTVFDQFVVHICITFWVELNVNKVYISQVTFFVAVAAYIQYCI